MTAVGVVLGAGGASRFGSPKQLAPFRGEPLINWPVLALRDGGLEQVVVVLGANHERIAPRVRGVLSCVLAPDWADGLSASLRAGARAATALGAEQMIVVLADQPLLSGQAVARVLALSRGGAPIVRASYGGILGHPTALSQVTFDAIAQLRGDAGARHLTGFDTVEVPCDGYGSTVDIDTPEDLVALQSHAPQTGE